MEHECERCEQHRDRNDDYEQLRDVRRKNTEALRCGKQHERKFTALGEADRQPLRRFIVVTADPRYHIEQKEFDDEQSDGKTENQQRFLCQQTEVRTHAHSDEKKTEQQSFEGLDVRLELVAKFRICEQDAGKKSAQRHR